MKKKKFLKFGIVVFLLAAMLTFMGAWREVATITKGYFKEIRNLTGEDLNIYQPKFHSGVTLPGSTPIISDPVVVDLAGTSYYTIDRANGSEFWIDDHESTLGTRVSSGVSILLPKITASYDGYEVKILKAPGLTSPGGSGATTFSGTTKIVISIAGTTASSGVTDHIWNATTGVTYESQYATWSGSTTELCEVSEIDAVGDWLKFKALYDSSGSTWYQVGRYIQ